MTFDDLLAVYVRYRILRPATVASYRDAIRNLERYFFSCEKRVTPDLDALSTDQLLAHRQWCLERISASSYNKHRRHLRALLNFAKENANIAASPLLKVTSAPVGARRPKVVPQNWYRRSMALLGKGPSVVGLTPTFFWKAVFSVMHFTGLRRRQLIELRWRDVDFVRSSLLLASEGSKTKREWVVPLPKWLTQDLRELRQKTEGIKGRPVELHEQLFCLPVFSKRLKAKQMGVGHLSRGFESLSRHFGYTISAHRVRHTSATVMMMATGHLKGVSDMLGHSDIKLTAATYVHPSLSHLRRVQSALPGYKLED